MKALFSLLRASRRTVVFAILTGIISGISSASLIALISTALTRPEGSLGRLGLSFIALCLVVLLAGIASQILLIYQGQRVVYDLRMKLAREITLAPLHKLEEIGAPRLLATLTDDVGTITMALLSIPPLCTHLATVIVCLVYLGWLSLKTLGLLFVFIILGVFIYHLLVKKALRFLRAARQEQDQLFDHFRALTSGTKELKLHYHRRESFLSKALQASALIFRRNNNVGMTIYTVAASWGQLLQFVFIGLLLFALPNLQGLQIITGYTLTILYMMGPLSQVLGVFPMLARANVSLQHIETLGLSLAAQPNEAVADAQPEAIADWEQLELVGVTHSYQREGEDESFTLGPLDLTFRRGELAFLVGGNGSGKTTLAKLLAGLYTPDAGVVRIDGRVVTPETQQYHRQHFSVVFSDFYLFNSLLGLDAPDLDLVARDYLARLQLERKVKIENGRLSTTELSQGQRKRLALLTALMEDRPFYVFDEWAADQDPQFKEVFYLQLLPELKSRGKTVLVISHDDKYFYLADRIIKLDYGQLEYDRQFVQPADASSEVLTS
jgi:putative ATP-binding cassette transporter